MAIDIYLECRPSSILITHWKNRSVARSEVQKGHKEAMPMQTLWERSSKVDIYRAFTSEVVSLTSFPASGSTSVSSYKGDDFSRERTVSVCQEAGVFHARVFKSRHSTSDG